MIEMQRGFRSPLDKYIDPAQNITITIQATAAKTATAQPEYDSCCFAVDAANQLSDENYMIFYNQTQSPKQEITMSAAGPATTYTVALHKLPAHIHKLVFTLAVDGDTTLAQLDQLDVKVTQNDQTMSLNLNGNAFGSEKAVIALEIYRKEGWRIAVVASGFSGGLSALLKHYGGVEEEAPEALQAPQVPQAPVPQKISLEKRLEKEAPHLVSLVKPLRVSLEKHKLTETVAQVALLIDISGSMRATFKRGTVQKVIDKMVPLAMQFDDNEEFEMWYFGKTTHRMPPVTIGNYAQATADWMDLMLTHGGGTNLAPAIEDVIDQYRIGKIPAYVLCITDGATSNEGKVKKLIKTASDYPIFWQFVGIGGKKGDYGTVEALDDLKGRTVDNANFFSLDDLDRVDNTELYTRMLAEFPKWLQEAKRLRIL